METTSENVKPFKVDPNDKETLKIWCEKQKILESIFWFNI